MYYAYLYNVAAQIPWVVSLSTYDIGMYVASGVT